MSNKMLDPLAGMDDLTPKKKPKKKASYSDPLASVSVSAVSKASKDSRMAGQYLRRSFNILPEMDEAINTVAKETGMGKLETVRWLVAIALEAYKGGKRPKVKQVKSVEVVMPDWEL